MLIASRRVRRKTRVAGCTCPKTTKFLSDIGCRHAAKMHAHPNLAASAWPGPDWLIHFWEEDIHLFSRCEDDPRVPLLRAHHAIFRAEIHQYGKIVSLGLLDIHNKMEEDLVDELMASTAA